MGKDLNRDFPDPLLGGKGRLKGPLPALGTEQPETAAVMQWAASRPFVASAGMHEVSQQPHGNAALSVCPHPQSPHKSPPQMRSESLCCRHMPHWARRLSSRIVPQGALVANYPWDANDPGETGYAKSPDDATFRRATPLHELSKYDNLNLLGSMAQQSQQESVAGQLRCINTCCLPGFWRRRMPMRTPGWCRTRSLPRRTVSPTARPGTLCLVACR